MHSLLPASARGQSRAPALPTPWANPPCRLYHTRVPQREALSSLSAKQCPRSLPGNALHFQPHPRPLLTQQMPADLQQPAPARSCATGRRRAPAFLPHPPKTLWPSDGLHNAPPAGQHGGWLWSGTAILDTSLLGYSPCMTVVGATRAVGLGVSPALAAISPRPTAAGAQGASARSQAPGHGSRGAGRGSVAGANPPVCRPAQHLAGHPSKTVRHRFAVGSPLRQTNPGSLNLPGKSPADRRAAGRGGRGYYHALILSANPDFTL